jgi:hypothetical protein
MESASPPRCGAIQQLAEGFKVLPYQYTALENDLEIRFSNCIGNSREPAACIEGNLLIGLQVALKL